MFTAEQLRTFQTQTPFIPFRIRMTNGSSYNVDHPENIFISRGYVHVGVKPTANGIPDEVAYCALMHITSIEELQPA